MILGIGPITASAIVATIPEPSRFQSGRQFADWLGLTPNEHSTGGKQRLGRITRARRPLPSAPARDRALDYCPTAFANAFSLSQVPILVPSRSGEIGFGQIVVHAGLHAFLAVALQRMRGDADDRRVAPVRASAARIARAAS